MSPSLYGYLREHGPASPEEIASGCLGLGDLNGEARSVVERLVADDPRFVWEGDLLRAADPLGLPLHEAPYVVFDLETTGSSAREGGITELGALKLLRGRVVDRFCTLVNPGRPIEPFVARLTGITDEMVAGAPPAGEVIPRFEEFVEGSVLVAHNASFDCSFVTAARGGRPLPNPVLDTLRLARLLVPGLRRYRLSALAAHFGVRQAPNHRALADAAATAGVFLRLVRLLRSAGVGSVGEALALRGGRRITPQKHHLAGGLPASCGVYYFLDGAGRVLYVGKAKNLRSRVRTYFSGGDGRRKVRRLVEEVASVRFRTTETELEALLLEAREIRRLSPRYNTAGRGEERRWYIGFSRAEPYPVPVRFSSEEAAEDLLLLGPYRSAGMVDACIEALGRIFPLRRCSVEGGPCLYGQMGRCAPCMGMDPREYAREVVGGIAALLRGEDGGERLDALRRERDRLAAALEFEAAARLRDLVSGIERLRLTRILGTSTTPLAAVAPSTESGMVEVFVFAGGALLAHGSFGAEDEEGLRGFAARARKARRSGSGVDEARVVLSYLRRRSGLVEVTGLDELVEAVRRVGKTGSMVQ
ncbi:UvrABC system protein C [Rubrobacter xylanophilus DSM 9941]|uniref:DEDD exonuclease domain-containing protein n=1 Tax=Rubrobacter xylanophilus TaxID=49319 RepID=UPI001C6440CD|nr:DEDD exonuclease domain-containing protein [Rubrobacter xylanophilus]QYJ16018.1 UvrABC system protein C [Rubrobacter xylanophilus DSM 9941]